MITAHYWASPAKATNNRKRYMGQHVQAARTPAVRKNFVGCVVAADLQEGVAFPYTDFGFRMSDKPKHLSEDDNISYMGERNIKRVIVLHDARGQPAHYSPGRLNPEDIKRLREICRREHLPMPVIGKRRRALGPKAETISPRG